MAEPVKVFEISPWLSAKVFIYLMTYAANVFISKPGVRVIKGAKRGIMTKATPLVRSRLGFREFRSRVPRWRK